VDCSLRADGTVIDWPAGSPVGACQYGKRSCRDGVWGKCTGAIEPRAEDSCTADDDSNCNGKRNEGCECMTGDTRECGTDVGICKKGMQTCSGGTWSTTCSGAIPPSGSDSCEPDSDNDCDGVANEGCACVNGTTATCGQAVHAKGVCAARMVSCRNGAWQAAACSTTDPEVCDDQSQDENCDGSPNEGCSCVDGSKQSCGKALGALGECANGNSICSKGKWGACDVAPAARDTCKFLAGDENCNGVPWQRCDCIEFATQSCSVNGCGGGTQRCSSAGTWGDCTGYTCPVPDAGM
jgi:hypothetical protein